MIQLHMIEGQSLNQTMERLILTNKDKFNLSDLTIYDLVILSNGLLNFIDLNRSKYRAMESLESAATEMHARIGCYEDEAYELIDKVGKIIDGIQDKT